MNPSRLLVLLVSLPLLLGGCGEKNNYPFKKGDLVYVYYTHGSEKETCEASWIKETKTQVVVYRTYRVRTNIEQYLNPEYIEFDSDGKIQTGYATRNDKGLVWAYETPEYISKSAITIISARSEFELITVEESKRFMRE
ncbi:hypothetical protein OAK16_04515 [Verrucomicrobia bacterium]|nr:hypothetical protein [Verrucomicrobiota bacterium]